MNQLVDPLAFEAKLSVRWSDMDAFGHVNNSIYFTYLEQARILWMETLQHNLLCLKENGPVLVHAECTYLKSIKYPNTLLIRLFPQNPGHSSFNLQYEICDEEGRELFAKASSKVVWIDWKSGHSMQLPDVVRQVIPMATPRGNIE